MDKWRNKAGEELFVPVHMLLDCTTLQDERRQWCIGGLAWVRCEERVPELDTEVLVATGAAEFPITVGYWDGKEWFTQEHGALHAEAWMPLPPLPASPKA